jgi:hypothetical protein
MIGPGTFRFAGLDLRAKAGRISWNSGDFFLASKEAVGMRALLALCAGDTPSRLLRRVSLTKLTSAPVRF